MNVIEAKDVWKKYKIPHEKKTTLFETLYGNLKGNTSYESFTALKDINFTVKKGEWLGIIGHNGSGKSTLLKIIANTIRPTKGEMKVNGKITSFLELGVGFSPDLSAKENIIVYGAVMGLNSKEIESRIDHILEFGGLTRFKDTKLKNFSSGMIVRLAFSTAIQIEPEVLLLDEVLAVGDLDFQKKCFEVFDRYRSMDKTVVYVSHDLGTVQRFCDKVLLLNHGEQVGIGDSEEMINVYQSLI
ncbi:ABC transporter ATP-binding protein [Methanolobus sediminis]|uniref:ABC transporter ATP-binding protein n=1 Tax=Methanolobus sediminis TaxID=3072978 RepID=A0AA51UIY3_9EURY|nr:ABC transporter ATP-binding protein [Methanolobus sediminis]WMW24382.1 ABC transporter ATP-binding protein [Methanolobus sediminis]